MGISALGSDGSSLSNNYGGRRSDNDFDQGLGMIGSGINGAREPSDKNPLQSKYLALESLIQSIVVEKRISISAFTDCMAQLF